MGETASRLTVDFDYEKAYPEVPWRQIKGLRNILVHMFWGSDQKVLWSIVDRHLPEPKVKIERWILEKEEILKDEPKPGKFQKKESKLSRKVRDDQNSLR